MEGPFVFKKGVIGAINGGIARLGPWTKTEINSHRSQNFTRCFSASYGAPAVSPRPLGHKQPSSVTNGPCWQQTATNGLRQRLAWEQRKKHQKTTKKHQKTTKQNTGKPSTNHDTTTGKPRELENHEKNRGKPRPNHGETTRKPRQNHARGKPWTKTWKNGTQENQHNTEGTPKK